ISAAVGLAERGGAGAKVLSRARRELRRLEEAVLAAAVPRPGEQEELPDMVTLAAAIERAEGAGVNSRQLQEAQAALLQLMLLELRKQLVAACASTEQAVAAKALAAAAKGGSVEAAAASAMAAAAAAEEQASSLELSLRRAQGLLRRCREGHDE
ncbi:unnamed protein product, partial [Polarella glacialis]